MAFTLTLPSLTSALRQFYPMKIYENGNPVNMLPCDIMEIQEVRQWDIPSMPIDSNAMISDNIYKAPRTLQVRIFVNVNDYDSLQELINTYQFGNGFEVSGLDEQKYKDLRLIDISEPQTIEMSGAYFINLSFREVILVEAFGVKIPVAKAKNAGYSSKNNKGTQNTQEKKKSALKTGTDWISSKF